MGAEPLVPPRLSLEELTQHLQVLADAAMELGLEHMAAVLNGLAGRPVPPELLTAEHVMVMNGLPTERPVGISGHRSGRTTWMLAELVALMGRQVPVELTGHDPRYEQNLVHQAVSMAERAGVPPGNIREFLVAARTYWRGMGAHLEFEDHYSRDLRRERGR